MIPAQLLGELRLAQDLVTGLAEDLNAEGFRRQYHPDLSPLGWHLGHCTYVECYWLQEIVQGDERYTVPVARLYTPPHTPKPERGSRLPPPQALLQWIRYLQSLNLDALTRLPAVVRDHPLMQDDYLVHFLIQHYSQHFETMLMALTQRSLAGIPADFQVSTPFGPEQPNRDTCSIDAGHYRVGGQPPAAYDNELPAQQATLGPYEISRLPVTNSEFLAFIDDGGYLSQDLWSKTGWRWRQQNRIDHPDHWRRDGSGNWYAIGNRGAYELTGNDVLHGISRHEAQAYASWAGGRLPHEHQWEVACRLHLLDRTGLAWEWCDNAFYPYEGFRAFPYEAYSAAWFDGNHYTLRGASLHTRPAIRRPSFRNFYRPEIRHAFAGLRLAY